MKIVVSENMLKDAAFICGPESSFIEVLTKGEQFKKAGLTPLYIFDNVLGTVQVTVENDSHKKLLN